MNGGDTCEALLNSATDFNLCGNDFEGVVNKPKTADYQVLCSFVQVLSDEYTADKIIDSSLLHLQITLADYPCEYLLQPPHLFLKLLALWRRLSEMHKNITPVLDTLLLFVQCLKKRLYMPEPWSSFKWSIALHENLHREQQLRLNAALNLLMSHCIMQLRVELQQKSVVYVKVYKLLYKLQEIYKSQQLKYEIAHLQQLFEICEKLQKQVHSSFSETLEESSCLRHKYLLCIFLLEQMIINNGKDNLLNETDNTYAHIELLNMFFTDYALQAYFPQQMENYRKFLIENCSDLPFKRIFIEFDAHKQSYTYMIQLLLNAGHLKPNKIIEESVDNLYCLLKLESSKLLQIIINAVHDSLPDMLKNTALKHKASKILLNLLQIPLPKLRFLAFDSVLQLMKKFFICIIDNNAEASLKQQLRNLLVGVPLTAAFLQQVVEEYASCNDEELQEICLEILNLPLRVVHVDEEFKQKYLHLLKPVLPVMQCLCSNNTSIFTKHILELGNPDADNLPTLELLRLNCALLFNKEAKLRSEALSRVIYILQQLDVPHKYLPNIMQISNMLPADMCIIKPTTINAIFSIKSMPSKTDKSNLIKVLSLLEHKHNADPLTRKSALIQLNSMLQNWQLMSTFFEQDGPFLVLDTLEQCLKHSAINEYTSAALPAVGILCKSLCFDADLLLELSKTINMYVLLLRSLFIYHNDYQVCQDVSFTLILLLFNDFVHVMPTHDKSMLIEVKLPAVVELIDCPLKFEKYFKSSSNRVWRKNGSIFNKTQSELQYLRVLIATVACKHIENIDENYVKKQLEKLQDININLHLSLHDCRLILITNMLKSMQQIIYKAENSIQQSTLKHYLNMLELQLILYQNNSFEFQLQESVCNQLVTFLDKYLQILPKHKQDNIIYKQFMNLTAQCFHLHNTHLQNKLCYTFNLDCKHTLFVLLRQEHELMSNHLFYQLSYFITLIFQSEAKVNSNFMQLFEQLMLMLQTYFKKREFQRVRCLLILLRQMIQANLTLTDEQLYKKSKLLLQISFTLKSFHFTGAQLQRDCLFIVLQMVGKMQKAQLHFKPQPAIIKNLANLAATHQCAEVRTLVWCLIKNFMQFQSKTENGTEMFVKALESNEHILEAELENNAANVCYFANVCLNILLARHEKSIVRCLAGYAFIDILTHNCLEFDSALSLLQQHEFFAHLLRQCENAFVQSKNVDILNCQIVILQNLLNLNADYAKQFCSEQRCMQTLQNLIKRQDLPESMQYAMLCANICQLFALIANNNYKFIQSTLCQDCVFLTNFVQLFKNINCQLQTNEALKLMQLFLVFSQDASTVSFLLQQFDKSPESLIDYFLTCFDKQNINSKLQNTALVLFSQLIVSLEEKNIFCHILAFELSSNTKYAFEEVTRLLYELLTANYTLSCSQFDVSPSNYKQNLMHAFSLLLRCCAGAYDCAQQLKLLDYLLNVLQHFFDEYTVASNTLPARFADKRRQAIIENLQLFVQFLLTWHAATYAIISDEIYANRILKMLTKIWVWANQNINLKYYVLQLCAVLSEQSLIIARKFSAGVHANGDTLLQIVAKTAKTETQAVRALLNSHNYVAIIEMSLRIVMNCCACLEGRMCLVKMSLVDVIHNLQPFNMKANKQKPEILLNWLQFWELFSRYPEGAKAIYLSSLCQVISSLSVNSKYRLICLCILRNFCFQANNRTALMASNDFIHTAYEILSRPVESTDMLEEKFIIITGLWKLISGGAKFVSNIRGTKLAKKMCQFCEKFCSADALISRPQFQLKNHDFHNVLKVIYDILNE